MRPRPAILFIVAILAAISLIAGCGGGGGGGGSSSGATAGGETGGGAPEGGSTETRGAEEEPQAAGEGEVGGEGTSGGEAAAESGGGKTVPKAQFVKQGDAICTQHGTQIQAGLRPFFKEGVQGFSKPEVAEQMVEEVIAPELEAEIAAIRKLGKPDQDSAEAEAFLTALQESVEAGRADPQEMIVGSTPFIASEKAAKSFGFKACGGVY